MRDSDFLKANLQLLYERIGTCRPAHDPSHEVELLAVTKGHAVERLRALHTIAPNLRFAENYQQELQRKAEALRDLSIRWVFIGRIQSNKLKKIVDVCEEIQTVESWHHAQLIANYAQTKGESTYPVFIAVNLSNNPRKGGLPLADALLLAGNIASKLPSLRLRGLMTVPDPLSDHARLASLRGEVPQAYREFVFASRQVGEGHASLGMSDDLEAAVTAGSHCVRIGTALLGPRSAETSEDN